MKKFIFLLFCLTMYRRGLAQLQTTQPLGDSFKSSGLNNAPILNATAPQNFGSFGGQRNIPTVIPERPFNPTQTCALLKTALQGVGRDSETIMKILARHTRDQRFELAATYKSLYGLDLVQQIMREYDGKLQDVIQYLFWPTEKMYAREFREAVRGLGTNEEALIEMCVSLDGQELRKISSAYQQMYEKKLEKDIKDDTSGFFQDLLIALVEGRQADVTVYPAQTPGSTAEALKNLGPGNWDKQKDTIRDIFCKKSFPELRSIFVEYERLTGHKIEEAIEREFKKDIKKTLLAIVQVTRNRPEYFAEQLSKAIPSVGIKHDILHRIIVGRCEIDLGNIKEEFFKKTGKNIDVWLKHVLEGYYWDLMVQLAGYEPQFFTN